MALARSRGALSGPSMLPGEKRGLVGPALIGGRRHRVFEHSGHVAKYAHCPELHVGGNGGAFGRHGEQIAPREAPLVAMDIRVHMGAAASARFPENRQLRSRGLAAASSVDVANRSGECSGAPHSLAGALPTPKSF